MTLLYDLSSTIFALATPQGKSGVAIFRVSGPNSQRVLEELTTIKNPTPNKAYFTKLSYKGDHIDSCLVIFFKAPHSFTGEDVLELHVHGSLAILKDLTEVLSSLSYLRVAEPGEFAKTAFYNQKLGLTEAEGLSLLIDSESTLQRRVAMSQMEGAIQTLYENWRSRLLISLANIEALIDFPDEDIPQELLNQIKQNISEIKSEMSSHLNQSKISEMLFDGIKVVIVGPPNSGKSSLLNYLVQQEAAIVSEIPGTTRDTIQIKTFINGFPVVFLDTAGIRETDDLIEKEGVRRSLSNLESADLVISMLSSDQTEFDFIESKEKPIIKVINKIDLKDIKVDGAIGISVKNNINMDAMFGEIQNFVSSNFSNLQSCVITKTKYREAVSECVCALEDFLSNINNESYSGLLDICSEDLRCATSAIGRITGFVGVEELLDHIFSNFCIGK